MDTGPKIAQVAALVGDPTRATMLAALLDGRALTASELAYRAGVAPQTASGHLSKLRQAGLLAGERQGRHRYVRLASPQVARMLERLMVVAEAMPVRAAPRWRGGEPLRRARTCYDHMAGGLAVAIADRLTGCGHVVLDGDGGVVTESGHAVLTGLGLDLPTGARRPFCRPCLDWSERRPHLAGVVGAALLGHALDRGWVRRLRDSRALDVPPEGERALVVAFGLPAAAWAGPGPALRPACDDARPVA